MNPGVKVRVTRPTLPSFGLVGLFLQWYQRTPHSQPFCLVLINNEAVGFDPWDLEVANEVDSTTAGDLRITAS